MIQQNGSPRTVEFHNSQGSEESKDPVSPVIKFSNPNVDNTSQESMSLEGSSTVIT